MLKDRRSSRGSRDEVSCRADEVWTLRSRGEEQNCETAFCESYNAECSILKVRWRGHERSSHLADAPFQKHSLVLKPGPSPQEKHENFTGIVCSKKRQRHCVVVRVFSGSIDVYACLLAWASPA